MGINGLHALAVKRAATRCPAVGQADGNRTWHLSAPIEGGSLVDNLIKAHGCKIRKLHFDDRPHSSNSCTHGETYHGVFRNWRIKHPAWELAGEVLRGLKRTAERADVLAVN